MLSFLFKKQKPERIQEINSFYKKLKELYNYDSIDEERKNYLKETIEKFGYLPYPHIKALEELSPAETLFGLETKWKLNNVFDGENFTVKDCEISPVSRAGINNSDWLKKEQHNIKLVNLAGLGDGNQTHEVGQFIDWLKQILILPSGKVDKGVLSTTLYLIPFHPREFGCAYLPSSASVSENLQDKDVHEATGYCARSQVKFFISLAQLAGHPILYDVLPQTGRYSKVVLANPHVARWFDVKSLITNLEKLVDETAEKLKTELDPEDVEITKKIYKSTLLSGSDDLSSFYKSIYDRFDKELEDHKRALSHKMLSKPEQDKIHKRVKDLVAKVHSTKAGKIFQETHITQQGQTIQTLIKEGLWPAPGGAWCSSGIPIFDKMSECGSFPVFKHYNHKDEDVTVFANLDCQTPYYFFYLDLKDYNTKAIETMNKRLVRRQQEYNFDGIRFDHVDHIVDEYSEKDGIPISYRVPKNVLKETNKLLKESNKHCACLAEYMLGGHYYKEYHKDMLFDVLWGDDVIAQSSKTPQRIIENNQDLLDYNSENPKSPCLSILKTYNNQDGEFREIDQYPGQLGKEGALFKWFKFKFLPGGKLAQRPVLYVDGDESFTKTGIEGTIVSEIPLARAKDYDFFEKFDAINRFALDCELTREGEAQIINQEDEGFCAWMVSKDPLKETLLVVANYLPPTEQTKTRQEDGSEIASTKEAQPVYDKTIELPGDFKILSEIFYDYEQKSFIEKDFGSDDKSIHFDKIEPSEFKIYRLTR